MESASPPGRDQGGEPASERPPSPLRQTVEYLRTVRGLVNEANAERQPWLRRVGLLIRDAQRGEPETAEHARQAGVEQLPGFEHFRARLARLEPPPLCDSCHSAAASWLDKHIAACEALIEIGASGDLHRLRVAHGLLAEARVDLRRFSSDLGGLAAGLRAHAEQVKARRATRAGWLLGPKRKIGGRPARPRPQADAS